MKTRLIFKKLLAIVLTSIAIGYGSCVKPQEPDYREKWVGEYECERRWAYLSKESDTIIIVECVSQNIVVVRMKGDFILNFSQKGTEMNHDAKVNADGSFFDYSLISIIVGEFFGDSLFMTNYGDTMVCGEYKGKKNKDNSK